MTTSYHNNKIETSTILSHDSNLTILRRKYALHDILIILITMGQTTSMLITQHHIYQHAQNKNITYEIVILRTIQT